jgi:mono/diheme cytochrome c family protein
MAEVVHYSTQFLKDGDLHAINVYIGSAHPQGKHSAQSSRHRKGKRGKKLYVNHCATCHRAKGRGLENVFPALAGSAVVNDDDPTSLLRLILYGASETTTRSVDNALAMPAYAHYLDNQQIATLASFLRASWGNHAGSVDAGQVSDLRKTKYRDTGTLPLTGGKPTPSAGLVHPGREPSDSSR